MSIQKKSGGPEVHDKPGLNCLTVKIIKNEENKNIRIYSHTDNVLYQL